MLTFIREITCRVACLGLVLVSFEVICDSAWVRFVSFRWESSMPPGTRLLMFPSFNQVVPQEAYKVTSLQTFLKGSLSCYFVAFAVSTDHFVSLFGPRKALAKTVPEATMVLKDGFGLWMVAINFFSCDGPFTPVATSVMMDVNAALPRLILQPARRFDTKTGFWVKRFFKS